MIDRPYFMQNKKWYKYDYQQKKWVLTDRAPDAARKSLDKYNATIKEMKELGVEG